jgi:hypothetical protein
MTAATMPRKIRLTCSESALWQRYATRSAASAGHESELVLIFAESDSRMYQLCLGQNLMQALATAISWVNVRFEE